MAVKYLSDGKVDLESAVSGLRMCYQILNTVIVNYPSKRDSKRQANEGDGEEDSDDYYFQGADAADQVCQHIKALADELDDWQQNKWPEVGIVPSLFEELRQLCEEQLPRFAGQGIEEVERLYEAVVNSTLSAALAKRIDMKKAVERRTELCTEYHQTRVQAEFDSLLPELEAVTRAMCSSQSTFKGKVPADLAAIVAREATRLIALGYNLRTTSREAFQGRLISAVISAVNGIEDPDLKAIRDAVNPQKSGPTAGQSGRTAKARRPQSTRKATKKARQGQSRAA